MNSAELWAFLPIGYLITVAIELPILAVGLSRRHPLTHRLFAGLWLTACTYPIVVLVLPQLFELTSQRWLYLIVAETFAPVTECIIFCVAFGRQTAKRDCLVIVIANLASFGFGELLTAFGAWEWFWR